jgi:hypothetical protein
VGHDLLASRSCQPAVLIDGVRGRQAWIAPVAALLLLVAMGLRRVRLSLQPTGVDQVIAATCSPTSRTSN